jgi:hypothetical protein
MGGSPPVAGAAAGRLPRYRQQAVPAATIPQRRARTDSRAVLRSPGSLSPRKITIKGAPGGASPLRGGRPLTPIFPGKASAPIRRTGEMPKVASLRWYDSST